MIQRGGNPLVTDMLKQMIEEEERQVAEFDIVIERNEQVISAHRLLKTEALVRIEVREVELVKHHEEHL